MINEEKEYNLIKFVDEDFSLDVNVDSSEDTVWLTQKDMAVLFNIDLSRISRHIRKIFDEMELDEKSNLRKAQFPFSDKSVILYSLNVILAVGYRVKSKRGVILKQWAIELLNKHKANNADTGPLIVFNHGDISLDVSVDPNDDTVWLSKDQIVLLYETTRQNVEYHINNIYAQNELEIELTCKEILHFTKESERYEYRTIVVYNLDMIISLGYRINSKNGIIFRKWANKILKQYLLKGYVRNEDRLNIIQNRVMELENNDSKTNDRLDNIEKTIFQENNHMFFEGEIIEPYTFIRKLFFLAKQELIIIDNYADNFLLSMLKDLEVRIIIITSSNTYLKATDVHCSIKVIYSDVFHDRFIIVDDTIYQIGTSFNNIGKKRFIIMKANDYKKEDLLKDVEKA